MADLAPPPSLAMDSSPAQGPDLQGLISSAMDFAKKNPKEAAKNAKALGLADDNSLKPLIKDPDAYMSKVFGSGNTAAKTAPPQPKVVKKSTDMGQVLAGQEQVQQSNPYQDLLRGDDDIGDNAKKMVAMQPNSNAWIRTLAALGDQVHREAGHPGANMAEQITPTGLTPQERTSLLLKYQDEAQKRKQDLYGKVLTLSQKTAPTVNVTTGDQFGGMGGGMRGMAAMLGRASGIGKEYDKNGQIESGVKQVDSLRRAEDNLTGGAPITEKMWNDIQQNYINALDTSGRATEGKMARDLQTEWAAELADLKLRAGGKITKDTDLRQSPTMLNHFNYMLQQIHQVNESYNQQIQDAKSRVRSNYANLGSSGMFPPQMVDMVNGQLDAKEAELNKQYPLGGSKGKYDRMEPGENGSIHALLRGADPSDPKSWVEINGEKKK